MKYTDEQLSTMAKEALAAKERKDFRWDFLVTMLKFNTILTEAQIEQQIRGFVK